MGIKFGTDGWRGIIADDFTFANLRRVSAAVAEYIHSQGRAQQGLVIGRDPRFLAEAFAQEVADVISHAGIPVYLVEQATPTPVVAHAVVEQEAAGAVMLTASHNPPEYNGFKFIPHYAGPALPEITDAITALIPTQTARKPGNPELVQTLDPRPQYFKFLGQQVDMAKIRQSGLSVVVNSMHGAGSGYLETIFQSLGLTVTSQRNWRDALFGGIMPEPKPELLQDLHQAVTAGQGHLGLALDGDGDRFGIIDSQGQYILPNQVLALLAQYMYEQGKEGPIARSVSTTTLVDRIAESYGSHVIETPVGFKYLGQALMDQHALLAGEESGGLSIAGHIPEKDGILACLLMAEVRAHYRRPLTEILTDIHQKYGYLYTQRQDYSCTPQRKQDILAQLKSYAPDQVAGSPVTKTVKIDGSKFFLQDGSWVLIRPSGTEAIFRIYAEADSSSRLEAIQTAVATDLALQ